MSYKHDEAKELIHRVQNAVGPKDPAWDICVALHKLIAAIESDQQEMTDRIDRLEKILSRRP